MASEEADTGAGGGQQGARKPRRTKLMLLAAFAVLLLAGGGAAWWMLAPAPEAEHAAAEPVEAESLVDIAPMTVNLRTPDGAAKMLRVHLMLVPGGAEKEAIEGQLPLIIDAFQPFLRELRPEDIAGSAATFRIKEEMLIRSNAVLGRGSVRDVLIQDLVQQ